MLQRVVSFAPSLLGAKDRPIPQGRPPRLPRTMQPSLVSSVPISVPSASKEKTPMLSKSVVHPPSELPIMVYALHPSLYNKGRHLP